jgi:DNA polymerase-3 subunit beta
MKLTIQKNELLPVLAKVQGLTGRKTNLAITTNLLIKTTDSGISLSATDLETGFEGIYPANVESQGTIAINARKFYEIVRDFPSEEIGLNEIENHWIEIGNEHVEYHIVGMNPDDFPEIPKIEAVEFFEIDSGAMAKMIERAVVVSGATDDKRAHIMGVYSERIIEKEQKIFRLVSTDGSRLSKIDYFYDKDYKLPEGSGLMVPKKGLIELNKFLDAEGLGSFPEYTDIVQKSAGNDIYLDRQLFLMMLKRMSILSSEDYKGVIFNFSEDKLVITSTNPDIGESKEDMGIEFRGEPITVMFNPRFFIDTLGVMDDEKVLIHIVNEEKPCLIEGEDDKTYLSVIMPMRI